MPHDLFIFQGRLSSACNWLSFEECREQSGYCSKSIVNKSDIPSDVREFLSALQERRQSEEKNGRSMLPPS